MSIDTRNASKREALEWRWPEYAARMERERDEARKALRSLAHALLAVSLEGVRAQALAALALTDGRSCTIQPDPACAKCHGEGVYTMPGVGTFPCPRCPRSAETP